MTTPGSEDSHSAPPSSDRLQARHLRVLLTDQAQELDATLVVYGSALARYLRRGEHTQARRVRGLIRTAERERRSVQQMIARLEDRFALAAQEHAHDLSETRRSETPAARVHPHPSPHRVIRA